MSNFNAAAAFRLALAIIALAAAAPALAQRTAGTSIMPAEPERRAVFEQWGFADAVVSGDTVYLSGVVASLREGESDPRPAFERAFAAIAAILARAGVGWDDVVEMTTYHTDIPGQIDAFTEVKHRYVKPPFPAWSAIGVSRLVSDRGIAEIRVIARRRR